ncbi:hypothetical protein [Parapedobacter sp. 2B3]|uniref:hypothetical protein n=1 Tax=Parapedobacter sp. 2B3 TaxID=3342381 RepID=UPI0035B60A4F
MQTKTAKHLSLTTGVIITLGLSTLTHQAVGMEHAPAPLQTTIQYTDSVAWGALSGYYRFPNRAAHIRFFEQNGQFVAQQVWDGRVYPLQRTGALVYQSQEEAYKIEFIEGNAGKIEKAKILDRITLEKVAYDPTQHVELTAGQLKPLLGRYRLEKDPSMELSISTKDGKLTLTQHWDNQTLVFDAFSPTVFFNAELTFPLTFVVEDGVANELICFESDQWERVAHD